MQPIFSQYTQGYEAALGRRARYQRRSTLRILEIQSPQRGGLFFFCRPHQTTEKRKAGLPLHFYRTLQRHQGQQKPPQGIFCRSQGHPRQPLRMCKVALMYSKGNLLPLVSLSEIVSCETGPDESLLWTWNVSVLPLPHFLFPTGTDLSNVDGCPLCRLSEELTSARCTQIPR